jgi:hypothetical protein
MRRAALWGVAILGAICLINLLMQGTCLAARRPSLLPSPRRPAAATDGAERWPGVVEPLPERGELVRPGGAFEELALEEVPTSKLARPLRIQPWTPPDGGAHGGLLSFESYAHKLRAASAAAARSLRFEVSLAAVVHAEDAPYVCEWIEYHRCVAGVDHFFLLHDSHSHEAEPDCRASGGASVLAPSPASASASAMSANDAEPTQSAPPPGAESSSDPQRENSQPQSATGSQQRSAEGAEQRSAGGSQQQRAGGSRARRASCSLALF